MTTTPPLLVTGGTGTLGRLVVPLLREAGHPVRVLSRHEHPAADGVEYVAADLLKGEGLQPALTDVSTVLHLAGGPKGGDRATEHLVRAAARAEVRHLVLISVIGAGRVPLGYLRAKAGAERAVAGSGVPWTTLRAAQFHELVFTMARALTRLPVVPVPSGLRLEPVAAREVAARLVELTLGEPAGLVPELAGPAVRPLPELVREYLQAEGGRRPLLPVRLPGRAGRAYREGANLAGDPVERATVSWERFLAERAANRSADSRR